MNLLGFKLDLNGAGSSLAGDSSANGSGAGGNIASGLLDAGASAIPFGSMIKDLLDGLGLQERIDNVMKYGISSWGASTSPEKAKGLMAQKVLPAVAERLKQIEQNPADMDKTLDAIDGLLRINMYYHDERSRKSRAKSSRLGHAYSRDEYRKLLNTLMPAFVDKFRKAGVKITKVKVNKSVHELMWNAYLMDQGQPFSNDFPGEGYYDYQVDFSEVKEVTVDEKGNVKSGSGGGGILALAGIGFAILKGMK